MRKILIIAYIIPFMVGCSNNHSSKHLTDPLPKNVNKEKDKLNGAPYNKQVVDSMIRTGAISADSVPDLPPTQVEEKRRLQSSYNNIRVIDTTFNLEGGRVHFHSKYFCLIDSNLVIPRQYDLSGNKKPFLTHPFAIDLWLVVNQDTVLKRRFKADDFTPFYKDNFGGNLNKYGNIIDAYFPKQKSNNSVILNISLAIPATDLGVGTVLSIDKKGNYKIYEVD